MHKILLIIQREYLTRVKKKSFIVMTILGPVLMAGLMLMPILLGNMGGNESRKIAVVDESGRFKNKIPDKDNFHFEYVSQTVNELKSTTNKDDYYAILYLPANVFSNPAGLSLFSKKQPGIGIVSYIENKIQKEIESSKLAASGIDEKLLQSIKTNVKIHTIKMTDEGDKNGNSDTTTVVGFVGAFLIYIFIFLYGIQVMRGVIEEKTNRIVEVIISSVKPFQLMMGKILGIALVGLTQFLLWVILTFTINVVATKVVMKDKPIPNVAMMQMKTKMQQQQTSIETSPAETDNENFKTLDFLSSMANINFPLIIGVFIFYFLGGYLFYSAWFAAIGSIVDSETDTQQFMLPVTLPLILAFIVAETIMKNPDSPLGFWFSIIPFTSPIVMMMRIPFGVPPAELIASMALLVIGFILMTWMAAKIYRTGILMYGKKVNYRELGKWLFYKE